MPQQQPHFDPQQLMQNQHYMQQQQQPQPQQHFDSPGPVFSAAAGVGVGIPLAGDKLNNAPMHWQNVIWAFLFLTQLFGVLILGFVLLVKYRDEYSSNTLTQSLGLNSTPAWALVGLIVACGFTLSIAFLACIKTWPKQVIWASLIISILLVCFALIVSILAQFVFGIVKCTFILAITLIYVYCVREKVPLASEFVWLAVQSIEAFKGSYVVAICGLIISTVFHFLFFACASGIVVAMSQSQVDPTTGNVTYNTSSGARGFVYFLLCVSYFWQAFVVKYVVHTTVCGVTATWYFTYPLTVPPSPVLNSLRRALTTSFGSICLAALLISVIRAIRLVIDLARSRSRSRGGALAAMFLCLFACLIDLFESVAQVS